MVIMNGMIKMLRVRVVHAIKDNSSLFRWQVFNVFFDH